MKRHLSIPAALALAAVIAAAASAHGGAARADEPPGAIAITAKRFEFEPKEVHLKRGEAATLALTSQDVTHGFFSRPLGIDADLTPGKTVTIPVNTKAAGTFTVICDHFCGSGHGGMKMTVVVE